MSYHFIVDHLVMLKIITEECHNNKSNLLCCFFRKSFDTIPRTDFWNILEELKVPFELRATMIRLYENILAKFRNTER